MGPNHSLKCEKNLRGQGKFLVDLTWNDRSVRTLISKLVDTAALIIAKNLNLESCPRKTVVTSTSLLIGNQTQHNKLRNLAFEKTRNSVNFFALINHDVASDTTMTLLFSHEQPQIGN